MGGFVEGPPYHRGMTVDLPRLVIEQLEFDWDVHVWPRLEGLTDDEYLWEPVAGAANVRKNADGVWAMDRAQQAARGQGGEYAEDPMIALIIHVTRETIHHGAEICLLRDLYRAGLR